MGLFDGAGGGKGRGLFGNIDWDRLAGGFGAAQATLAGDPAQAAAILQNQQRLRAQQEQAQAEAEAAQRFRDEQTWGLKEMGYGNPFIAATTPQDASQAVLRRTEPYSQAPGTTRVTPSVNGGEDQRVTAPDPTDTQRTYEFLNSVNPELARSYLARQALIINSGIDPATGQPYSQAIDPRQLFNFGGPQQGAPQLPQNGPAAPPGPAPVSRSQPPASYGDPVAELTQLVGVRPSSGYRTQGHQDALVEQGRSRARRSQHTARNALDFPIPAGPSQQAAAARIRQRYPQAQFEFERSNLHVTLPGWGQAPDVSGSARRYPEREERLPRIGTRAARDRLPPGTRYIGPDGQVRTR